MKKFLLLSFLILTISLDIFSQQKTEVFVLSTLHQFHAENKNYSFETLSRIIERYDPDIIAAELTPADLENRKEQKTKQEYQKSVFPIADKHKYKLIALEPAEPKFSELVGLIRESEKTLGEKSPEKAEAFSVYSKSLYDYLFNIWDSPFAVNSPETDALFEVKHKFQNTLFGEAQEKGWNGWNQNFLDKILEAAKNNKGKKIIVLIGAEHGYWLRKRLRENSEIKLIEPQTILK